VETYRNRLAENAYRKIAPNYSKAAFDKAIDDQIKEDEQAADKVAIEASKSAGNIKSWGRFTTDLDKFKQAAERMGPGMTPDKLMGNLRSLAPADWTRWIKERQAAWGDKSNPNSAQALEELKAVERLHQMVAGKVVDYYHNQFGGAMSETELSLGRQVIAPESNFDKIYDFAHMGSKTAGDTWGSILSQAGPRAATLVQIRYGQDSPSVNKPGVQGTKKAGK
jgi:hypothetical protein